MRRSESDLTETASWHPAMLPRILVILTARYLAPHSLRIAVAPYQPCCVQRQPIASLMTLSIWAGTGACCLDM
jgi:hypothetical protein